MAHSYLITGGSQKDRSIETTKIVDSLQGKKIKNLFQNPDLIIFKEKDSIKIKQARELKKKLQLRPYHLKFKVAILYEAEKLTVAAQNALLKTLEEPPKKSVIILECANPELLLPTILSRVQIIQLRSPNEPSFLNEEIKKELQATQSILAMRLGERLKQTELITKTKETSLKYLQRQLHLWRQLFYEKAVSKKQFLSLDGLSLKQIAKTAKNIQKTHRLIKNQTNHKLAIENLLISYPKL